MNLVAVTAEPAFSRPHSLIYFLAIAACLVVTCIPLWSRRDRSWQRWVFWSGVFGVAVLVFLAALPAWVMGLVIAMMSIGFLSLAAYFGTPYIKLGGKIYAFHIDDSEPDRSPDEPPQPGSDDPDYDPYPDSYGGSVTASKMWWLLIPAAAICSFNVIIAFGGRADKPWLPVLLVLVVVLLAAAGGYGDASWRFRVARGQYVQFVIIGVLTAGIFPAIYLLAYAIGKQWPLRLKKSFEYQAHPHLRKLDDGSPQDPPE